MSHEAGMDRQGKLLCLADKILEKLSARVDASDPMELNPQAMKHITGVMKDLKDIQSGAQESDAGVIQVVFQGELEVYSG